MHPVAETVRTVKDSIRTEVRFHKKDTTITIPGDTSYIRIPITQLTGEPVSVKTGRATATVKKIGESIEVMCKCDEYKKLIGLMEKHINTLHHKIETSEETRTEFEKYVPWYIKVLAWIGGVFLVLIVGRIALKSIKPKL